MTSTRDRVARIRSLVASEESAADAPDAVADALTRLCRVAARSVPASGTGVSLPSAEGLLGGRGRLGRDQRGPGAAAAHLRRGTLLGRVRDSPPGAGWGSLQFMAASTEGPGRRGHHRAPPGAQHQPQRGGHRTAPERPNSRIIIEQAKAALAQHLGVGVDEAFESLRAHARRTHTRLGVVATAVLTDPTELDRLTASHPS